jgi:hypothetical protein
MSEIPTYPDEACRETSCCMRCGKRLAEDRGTCADCELLLLDDVIRLKAALEVSLRGERQMLATLTATQARCTALEAENRSHRAARVCVCPRLYDDKKCPEHGVVES